VEDISMVVVVGGKVVAGERSSSIGRKAEVAAKLRYVEIRYSSHN
jgi:hypothetical protein